jgi:hypothetical protein
MASTEFLLKALGKAAFCRGASRVTRNHLERAVLDTLTEMWRALAKERNLLTVLCEQFELLTTAQGKILLVRFCRNRDVAVICGHSCQRERHKASHALIQCTASRL